MTSPLVSVIMPSFNAERWIGESIESVLGQSWRNLQLIIVDDGSTDGSVDVAGRYVGDRVMLVRQRNLGASIARNAGLAVARGDYIQYLDADDLLDARKIELQIEALKSAPGKVATCSWGRFVERFEDTRFEPTGLWQDLGAIDFLVEAYATMQFMPNHAWLVPRATADRAGGWSPMRARNDDAEYFAKVVLASDGVRFVSAARAYYRSGHSGLSASQDRDALEGYLWTLEQIAQHVLGAEDSARTRSALAASFDLFVTSVERTTPDLAGIAERRVSELGGSRFSAVNDGPWMRLLSRLIGRSNAREARRAYWRRTARKR